MVGPPPVLGSEGVRIAVLGNQILRQIEEASGLLATMYEDQEEERWLIRRLSADLAEATEMLADSKNTITGLTETVRRTTAGV